MSVAAQAQAPPDLNGLSVDLWMPARRIAYQLSGAAEGFSVPVALTYQRWLADHLTAATLLQVGYSSDYTGASLSLMLMPGIEWHPFRSGFDGLFLGASGVLAYNTPDQVGAGLGGTLGWQIIVLRNLLLRAEAKVAAGLLYAASSGPSVGLSSGIFLSAGLTF